MGGFQAAPRNSPLMHRAPHALTGVPVGQFPTGEVAGAEDECVYSWKLPNAPPGAALLHTPITDG